LPNRIEGNGVCVVLVEDASASLAILVPQEQELGVVRS
jgi:hypothetical protein